MIFYVYEHWRPDKNVCFYVGKGRGRRAQNFSRKREGGWRHAAIVAKLKSLSLVPEVRFIKVNLSEAQAFALEIERIAWWRSQGTELANMTDGGDGSSGHKLSEKEIEKLRNRVFTEEHRRRISAAKKGKPQSPEHIERAAAGRRGKKRSPDKKYPSPFRGVPRSEETKAKMSAAQKGKPRPNARGRIPWCKGKHLSQETRDKMSAARRGKRRGPMSLVQKQKIRQTLLGRENLALKGKPLSEEHRQKLIDAWKRRKAKQADMLNEQVGRCSPPEVQDPAGSPSGARAG